MPTKAPVRLAASVMARFLTPATVGAVVDHGPTFRTITLTTPKPARWTPGDKVRIAVRDLSLRTYTPVAVDGAALTILAHLEAPGPGSAWCAAAEPGQELRILGPQGSIDLPKHTPAPLVVGDETTLGLYLAQGGDAAGADPPAGIFEVDDPEAASTALAHHGGRPARFVSRQPDDGHLDEMAGTVTDSLAAHPDVRLCLTGRAQTIAVLRRRLKDAGLARRVAVAKAYWNVNRAGLD
jgi:NADPH-dependent ferric siderophore reductase